MNLISSTGELDTLISSTHHASLVMAPVFGRPHAAEAAQLLIVMAGDYRSKKEIAHLLIPAVGRKVIDLGGNLEKGRCGCGVRPVTMRRLTIRISSQPRPSSSLEIPLFLVLWRYSPKFSPLERSLEFQQPKHLA